MSPADFEDQRAKRLVEREFNLSWAEALPARQQDRRRRLVEAGAGAPQFSVEEGIAKTLAIRIGDTMTWDVAGSRFSAKVTSLRKVEWDSFKANFFVIASPGVLESYPASWITSFHLAAGREEVVNRLVERFPNVSVIDLTAIMDQVKRISDQVSRAVEFVFLFAIAAGLVVLFAAITSTQDERIFEGAVMRTLGASRRQMVLTQLSEFLAIGLLSGLVAAGRRSRAGDRALRARPGCALRVQLDRAARRAPRGRRRGRHRGAPRDAQGRRLAAARRHSRRHLNGDRLRVKRNGGPSLVPASFRYATCPHEGSAV